MKRDYSDYNANDFASDENFQHWVLSSNEASETFWSTWLLNNPEKKHAVEEAKEIVLLMEFKPVYLSENKIDKIRSGYQSKIKTSNSSLEWNLTSYLKVAATIALLLISSFILFDWYQTQSNSQYYLAQKGQKLNIVLPDGSQVWLNGGSSLEFRKSMNDEEIREVTLEGEAYFDVKKNTSKPFYVNTSEISVKVLGTSFNVRAYKDDETVETTLVEGKVSINKKDLIHEELILKPDQQAVFSKKSEEFKLNKVNTDKNTSWKNGRLVIENETFYELAKKLERWYGTEIEIQKGGNCTVSAKIEDESLNEILELLTLTSKVTYQTEKNKITMDITCEN